MQLPAALPPENTRYSLNRRLGRRVRNISPQTGFDPRTVQPVASRYTDCAIPAHVSVLYMYVCMYIYIYIYTHTHTYTLYLGILVRELQIHEWAQRHALAVYLSGLLVHFIKSFLSMCS